MAAAKELIGRLRNVVRQVARAHPEAGVTHAAFEGQGTLHRSTPRILAYLQAVHPAVAKLDEALRPYFKGQSALALIEAAQGDLTRTGASQEVDLASLPADTAQVYARKRRLLELIEDLNAVARNAFYGEPALKARFNKALILRAHRARRAPSPA